ncbi:MAG TPA: hypothetical protein VEK06_04640 [Myxococcota bacterium]|nr:hypothetical protein [Myxococcota bacterium]
MSNILLGVDQLIEQVRSEALSKAEHDRERIIDEATLKANQLLEHAKKEAQKLLDEAHDAAQKEREAMAVELELAARDYCRKLHERLRAQMFFPLIRESVRATAKEPEFLKETLLKLITSFVQENPVNLDVLIPKELKTTLAAFFASTIFDALEKNCDIRLQDEAGLEGFVLIRRGEHFVWDFRVDTIAEELTRLVEPSLRKYFMASLNKSANATKLSPSA